MNLDHICRNPACVNPAHLREVTQKQNMENVPVESARSKSGFRGVVWDKHNGKWQAQVMHDRRQIKVGRYETIPEAVAAVQAKRRELYTHNDLDR